MEIDGRVKKRTIGWHVLLTDFRIRRKVSRSRSQKQKQGSTIIIDYCASLRVRNTVNIHNGIYRNENGPLIGRESLSRLLDTYNKSSDRTLYKNILKAIFDLK
jgi:hypothetical protein